MYKSLIGAFTLVGLLLFLCGSNPTTVAAEAALAAAQNTIAQEVFTATAATTVTTNFAEQISRRSLIAQNQRIVEIAPLLAQSAKDYLQDESFRVQTLYQLDNGNEVLLVTKQSEQIDKEIRETLGAIAIEKRFAFSPDPTFDQNVIAVDRVEEVRIPTLVGNPHSIGAAPLDLSFTFDGQPGTLIMKHWALTQHASSTTGLNLYTLTGDRTITNTGSKVRIIFFDTSPFTLTTPTAESAIVTTPFRIGTFPTLTIKVTAQTSPLQAVRGTDYHTPTASHDIRNHGLFAIALAYAVAPEAQFELIEVLNHKGEGTVGELTAHLQRLITESKNSTMPIVINLSLGVLEEAEIVHNKAHDDKDLQEFLKTISATRQLTNVVVVAAAGNFTETGPMQWPARHSGVIGVGASNDKGKLSCFSKRTTKSLGPRAAAPGGDAWMNQRCNPEQVKEDCLAKHERLHVWHKYRQLTGYASSSTTLYVCPNLLIGLMFDPTTERFQYAYWMGTSFATPIISGLAALQLQGASSNAVYASFTPGGAPDQLRDVEQGPTEPTKQECLPRYDAKQNQDEACPI